MKIATWNIEGLRHGTQLAKIKGSCEQAPADILVLTETDAAVNPNYKNGFHTPKLTEIEPIYYKPTENRVSIYTNYELIRRHATYDENTALCVELETERGNLLVYGTIIGVYGNRHKSFAEDLTRQLADIERLAADNRRLCVCGDFNCSFSDNYYFTKAGRTAIQECFVKNRLTILTKDRAECIDHIAISEDFITDFGVRVEEWNLDKELSDHKGIAIEIKIGGIFYERNT